MKFIDLPVLYLTNYYIKSIPGGLEWHKAVYKAAVPLGMALGILTTAFQDYLYFLGTGKAFVLMSWWVASPISYILLCSRFLEYLYIKKNRYGEIKVNYDLTNPYGVLFSFLIPLFSLAVFVLVELHIIGKF